MKKSLFALVMLIALQAHAGEITYQFSNPSFSGIGWSSHVLTIEQLEQQRKQKLKDDKQAALDKADRDYKATNAYKFQNNLESRIYAQLSKNIADQLFGEGGTTVDGEWYTTQSPFGDTISWKRETDNSGSARIYVEVKDSNGDTIASFDVPVGEFAF